MEKQDIISITIDKLFQATFAAPVLFAMPPPPFFLTTLRAQRLSRALQ